MENPLSIARKTAKVLGVFSGKLYLTANELAGLPELQNPETLQRLLTHLSEQVRAGRFDALLAKVKREEHPRYFLTLFSFFSERLREIGER